MSERRSLWGLRLLAVALAVLAWFLATAERRESSTSSTTVPRPVNFSTPEQMVILEPIEEVRVGVRGTPSRIQNLNPFQVSVNVDLRNAEKGTVEVTLTSRDVLLPDGLEFESIEPSQFVVELDRVVEGIRPVEPNLVGEPAAGAVVSLAAALPNEVLIRGPESLVEDLKALTTGPVNLDTHALDFDQRARVVPPDPRIQVVQPMMVTVHVELEIPTVGASR